PMIRLDSVSKRFPDGTIAVTDLSLEVPEGEISVLVGPSGCGKTTTLKMVNRLIEPTGGRIYLDDEDVTGVDPVGLRRRIGYVIQQVGLFPHQTIAANVGTVPRLLGQYDTPDEVLGNPASDFVADFVGADRALKRLKVTPIEIEDVEHPPTVLPPESLAHAREIMRRTGAAWVAVVDADDRLRGHVRAANAAGDGTAGDRAERVESWVSTDDYLENALAAMLLTDYGWV